jgi:SAM-dependent methyltransferase
VKDRLLRWLACPACGGDLALTAAARTGDEIHDGTLECGACSVKYAVVGGVPRLVPGGVTPEAAATAERFGYEWTRFAEIRPEYETQFLGWIAPVTREAFVGRRVLDAGCGKGRHLRLAAAFGADEVIGIDLGPAVEVAARNTSDLGNVHIVQGDLTQPPLRPSSMDLIYSIGVLHHLHDPAVGFRVLARLLAPAGRFVSWTYAREGNGWVLALVDPTRRMTSRLPLPLVRALAWGLTVPLWAALRAVYGPARSSPRLRRLLPYQSYLADLVPFAFREVHSIAFDQLLAPVAHYMSRADVERCYGEGGLALHSLRWHHANSWAAWGTRAGRTPGKPSLASPPAR